MKLNDVEISVSKYISEELENDVVLYNEERMKIVVLNHTASLIWKTIINNCNNQRNLSTNDIVIELQKSYNISEEEIKNIHSDVNETIKLLFQASLIKAEN